jgi:hypothetical protein
LPRKRKSTDKAPDKLTDNTETERPLKFHEMMRMLHMGRIPPGDYCKKTEYMDGRVKTEIFKVDAKGRIRGIQCSIEESGPRRIDEKKKSTRPQAIGRKRSSK